MIIVWCLTLNYSNNCFNGSSQEQNLLRVVVLSEHFPQSENGQESEGTKKVDYSQS